MCTIEEVNGWERLREVNKLCGGWWEYTKGVWMLGIYRERGGREMVYGCEPFKKDGECKAV